MTREWKRPSCKTLTEAQRAEAREMYNNGVATLSDIAHAFRVSGVGLHTALGLHRPSDALKQDGNHSNGHATTVQNGHVSDLPVKSKAVVPELTADFFNWMAGELVRTREALARSEDMLRNYQQVKVSNELATIYREYASR